MIDFVNLVRELMHEQEFDDINLTYLGEATSKVDNITNQHFDIVRYNDAKKTLTDYYPSGTSLRIPTHDEFKVHITTIANTATRGGVSPDKLGDLEEWFPILDLLFLFNSKYGNSSKQADSDADFTDWKKRVQTSSKTVPMDFVPASPDARIIKEKVIKSTDLGPLRLDTIKPFPFYTAVEKLMDIRRERMSPIVPEFVGQLFRDGKKEIQKIIFNPRGVISGSYRIDKKLEAVFDYGAIRDMSAISINLHKLFLKEVDNALSLFLSIIDPAQMMGTSGKSVKDYVTEKRSDIYKKLTENASLYTSFIGPVGSTAAKQLDYKDAISKAIAGGIAYVADPPDIDPTPYFKENSKALELNYIYNIDTLIAAGNGTYTEAKAVYDSFNGLANHIAVRQPGKRMEGATQIAKGLTLGVKNMGT